MIENLKLMKVYKSIRNYVTVDLMRALIIDGFMVVYSVILCIDCFRKGSESISHLALFNAVVTFVMMLILFWVKIRDKRDILYRILVNTAVFIECCLYWYTFGVFLYTGSMGGTSVFLIFIAAPIGFYFFNLFYGFLFCFGFFVGMAVYMWTPLHLTGYAFPEMYYLRLPLMYLVEAIVCALAQYETVKAQSRQEMALNEAERANRAKTDFLSNMSHEIRTPINAVLGMNEMILRESSKAGSKSFGNNEEIKDVFDDVNKYSKNIESAGNSLLSIINDILDFSKIEAGKLEIIENEYRLSAVLNDVSNMIFYKARETGLEFSARVDENLPNKLYGDEIRVRQVITNVLNNAVKYTQEGSVCLSVYGENADGTDTGDSICLVISVSDTGIGIKEEDIGKLFTKFQRVDLTRNSTVEGTGLGLAITRNLLDMMGGDISVESIYGKGSTFTIRLPQRVVSHEKIGDFEDRFEKNMNSINDYVESFHTRDARVLIVDDTKMNLMVVEGLLKNTGLKIDTALSGSEAVKMAETISYDIILMDQRMPGMGGTEAMQKIREMYNGINNETPIICLTADAVSGARERYLAEGFTDYITKPIDSKVLEKMLINYLPVEKIVSGSYLETEVYEDKMDNNFIDEFAPLRKAGFDVDEGLHYCQDDSFLYRTLLEEYVSSSQEKSDDIVKFYNDKDWENYGILVHSVKSSSKMIGATEFSLKALELEKAAGLKDEDTIKSKHQPMMEHYKKITDIVKDVVGDADTGHKKGEGIVLEFSPE